MPSSLALAFVTIKKVVEEEEAGVKKKILLLPGSAKQQNATHDEMPAPHSKCTAPTEGCNLEHSY